MESSPSTFFDPARSFSGISARRAHKKASLGPAHERVRESSGLGFENDVVSSAGNLGDGEPVRVRELSDETDTMVARIVPLREIVGR
jgi:hypothetical protein